MPHKAKSIFWDYLELCKPRVVALMLLTVLVGMALASTHGFSWLLALVTCMGVGAAAGSAAAINHLVDKHIDALMTRTKRRPVVSGRILPKQALIFAVILGSAGLFLLYHWVNGLTAVLTFITLIGYAVIYTGYLKRATPQNIVIGGLAGAAPPLLGWTAVTNHIDPNALLLVLIIFAWTPPHFWALAIYRFEDYQHAAVPMLPVIYGVRFTKLHIVLYTLLLTIATVLPCIVGMSGALYGLAMLVLNARFFYWVIRLYRAKPENTGIIARKTFWFSIHYLMWLFVALIVDHLISPMHLF